MKVRKAIDLFVLKKALILNGRFYKRHQFVIPTIKRLQEGEDEFVKPSDY